VATGCNSDGTCITEQALDGAACELDGEDGTCDATGACVADEDEEENDDENESGDERDQ
jgi:hypothetical protein